VALQYYVLPVLWMRHIGCVFMPPTIGGHLGQLGAQHHGHATKVVQTADPSAHGRRSTAIGGGISSRCAITCFKAIWGAENRRNHCARDASYRGQSLQCTIAMLVDWPIPLLTVA